MRTNKRRLIAAFLLLTALPYLILGMAAVLSEPEEPEERDPYDWTDYEGEVILDDPEFFLVEEETEEDPADAVSGEESSEAPQESEQQETENYDPAADAPGDSPTDDPPPEEPQQPANESSEDQGSEQDTPSDETANDPSQTTEEPADPPESSSDLKTLFLVEIKVPAGWFNLPEKAVRLTPPTPTNSSSPFRAGMGKPISW